MIRGHKVILDSDLAVLYGVNVGRLNEAVKRNRDRFPADFMFQLTAEEFDSLRSHLVTLNLKSRIAISSSNWGGRRFTRSWENFDRSYRLLSDAWSVYDNSCKIAKLLEILP